MNAAEFMLAEPPTDSAVEVQVQGEPLADGHPAVDLHGGGGAGGTGHRVGLPVPLPSVQVRRRPTGQPAQPQTATSTTNSGAATDNCLLLIQV